ncbi:hypothetical protein JT27_18520 [Alcaligenes faecalis]|uniref:dUTP diphosphatase n=1 Tax=Alcaligenes faecalis TaxID=511 RepID=UPI00052E3508|nr:dUTP diphosphatase [Alcaligenes faecalis]KGP00320.1 hypothetical protein JT27_18520 [Alcaligenes faecalis]
MSKSTKQLNEHIENSLRGYYEKHKDDRTIERDLALQVHTATAMGMVTAQMKSNELVAGVHWARQGLDFLKAARVELAEAEDHHNWKWWTKDTDMDPSVPGQIALELADAMKFIISSIAQYHTQSALRWVNQTTGVTLSTAQSEGDGHDAHLAKLVDTQVTSNTLASVINALVFQAEKSEVESAKVAKGRESVLAKGESILSLLERGTADMIGLVSRTPTNIKAQEELLGFLMYRSIALGFDPVAMFFAKSVLFDFRMDNGYKDGTYIKMWSDELTKEDKEDNYFLPGLASQAWEVAETEYGDEGPAAVRKAFNSYLYSLLAGEYFKRFAL